MKVRMSNRFEKMFRKKPRTMQERISWCIGQLQQNPRNPRLHVHKMQGMPKGVEIWEAYIYNDGNRLTFNWDSDLITLRNNCNHDMLYRNP